VDIEPKYIDLIVERLKSHNAPGLWVQESPRGEPPVKSEPEPVEGQATVAW
jgi:hypothetical protein